MGMINPDPKIHALLNHAADVDWMLSDAMAVVPKNHFMLDAIDETMQHMWKGLDAAIANSFKLDTDKLEEDLCEAERQMFGITSLFHVASVYFGNS